MAIEVWRPRRGLRQWDPFRDMEDISANWDNIFGNTMFPSLWSRLPTIREWIPALDVYEQDGKFVVKAELPGMDEDDINVSVEGNSLVIKGNKKFEREVKDEDYYHCERSYGSFYRSIPLPAEVDKEKIEANYDSGVLEVKLSKLPEKKTKKVKVTASSKKKAVK
jgi:HSP20 family protein